MGGYEGGQEASHLAVETVSSFYPTATEAIHTSVERSIAGCARARA